MINRNRSILKIFNVYPSESDLILSTFSIWVPSFLFWVFHFWFLFFLTPLDSRVRKKFWYSSRTNFDDGGRRFESRCSHIIWISVYQSTFSIKSKYWSQNFFRIWRFCDRCCFSATRLSDFENEEDCSRSVKLSRKNWVPRLRFWEAILDCIMNDVTNE